MWKNLKSLLNISTDKSTSIKNLKVNGVISHDENKITNVLNEYFCSVGQNTSNNIQNKYKTTYKKYLNNPITFNFKLFDITPNEIRNTIKKFKNKSSNILEIPIKIYKEIADIISEPLSLLFNECAAKGEFPKLLKISRITPIFKCGDEESCGNYRPISNIHKIAKIFEKIISNRMLNFINKHKLLNKSQFGFRPGYGTIDALHAIMNFIYNSINEKKQALAIFLDLSKAFDTVKHTILLNKLQYYGFRGKFYNLLESYLHGRQQYVQLENSKSDLKTVPTGVPQGTTLAPLLFTLYVNDLFQSHNLETISYADDTTILAQSNSTENMSNIVSEQLKKVDEWLCVNKLKLNYEKSSYLIFCNKKPIKKLTLK